MSLVLAIDTSGAECAVGLGSFEDDAAGPRVLGETNIAAPRAALTHLLPIVLRLLDECGAGIHEVDAVVVGRGPGSFTGVRIGVATAKGIAHGRGAPLWGVGTLDAVAERFAGREGLVGVVGDAMRKEVYPALFRCAQGRVERLEPDAVSHPDAVAERWATLAGGPLLLTGDGLAKYAEVFTAALRESAEIAPASMWTPTGASLLQAAWRGRVWEQDGSPATVLPVYTRLSDAEEAEVARLGRSGGVSDSGVAGPEVATGDGVL
jgi:N6-L-threonylcarbamoyladenine synthase/protein kinase Bud32